MLDEQENGIEIVNYPEKMEKEIYTQIPNTFEKYLQEENE